MKTFVIRLLLIVFVILLPGKLFSQWNWLMVPYIYPTIQTAIDSAADGDTVFVVPGTYYENIHFTGKKITVASGFFMGNDTSFISSTIIDGGQKGSVVAFKNDSSGSELCGFTITNGKADNGGGIIINNSNPALKNLLITNNTTKGYGKGGGIYIYQNSNPILSNLTISSNNAGYGGGIEITDNSSPALNNLEILNNNASVNVGGIFILHNSNPVLNNLKISNNKAGRRVGGIGIQQSFPVLRNIEITNNESESWGSGITITKNCSTYLYNITVCNNKQIDNSEPPAGGFMIRTSYVFLFNSIIRGNEQLNIVSNSASQSPAVFEIRNSNIGMDKILIDENSTIMNTNSVFDRDPMFSNTGEFPYSLKPNSPCIDAGLQDTTGMGLPSADMAGNIRIRDGIVDIGAYEWDGISSAFPPIPPQWTVDPSAYQSSMQLKGEVFFNSSVLRDSLSYVGAFVNGECRGTAGIKELAEWVKGIDMTIYGDNAGEPLSFKLWNSIYEEEYGLAETVQFTPGDSLGTISDPVKLSYTFVTAIDEEEKIPEAWQLSQNYPNPFNPETNINFALPLQEHVRLVIYDILGRPVKTLADGVYAAGVHSLQWNGRNDAGEPAASGAYIYRIVTKGFSQTRKMVFIK